MGNFIRIQRKNKYVLPFPDIFIAIIILYSLFQTFMYSCPCYICKLYTIQYFNSRVRILPCLPYNDNIPSTHFYGCKYLCNMENFENNKKKFVIDLSNDTNFSWNEENSGVPRKWYFFNSSDLVRCYILKISS